MLLNSKQLDELAKLQIEMLDIISELNNTKTFISDVKQEKNNHYGFTTSQF